MAISLNYTSFASKGFEIRNAMHHVLSTGESVRLTNRKGVHWLLVTLHKDALGYRFAFIDTDGREVGHMILKAAVRVWDDLDMEVFWRLSANAYDLTEHPLATIAKNNAREALIKAYGATHKVITYGGACIGYGGYQRDWLGRKRLYLTHDASGRALDKVRKVSKEAEPMIARLEAL